MGDTSGSWAGDDGTWEASGSGPTLSKGTVVELPTEPTFNDDGTWNPASRGPTLRPASAIFIGEYADEGSLPTTGLTEGDWAHIVTDDALAQVIYAARWNGTAWEVAERYEQGASKSGGESSWRTEIDYEGFPIRYWDGDPDNVRFSVDDAGAVTARSAEVFPSDNTATALVLKDDKSTSGNLLEAYDVSDVLQARLLASSDIGRFENIGGVRVFGNLGHAEPKALLDGTGVSFGAGNAATVDVRVARPSAGILLVYGISTGAALEMQEQSAPSTPSSNRLRLYVKDKSGVSALYTKNDAGTEEELTNRAPAITTRYVPPTSFLLDSATATNLGSAGTLFRTASLADLLTQGVFTAFYMPADTVAATALTLDLHWYPSATDATSKAVRWQITALVIAAGASATAAGTVTTFTGSTANKTAGNRFDEANQTILASVSAGDLVRLAIHRLGADAADTYTGAAQIGQQAARLSYTSSG